MAESQQSEGPSPYLTDNTKVLTETQQTELQELLEAHNSAWRDGTPSYQGLIVDRFFPSLKRYSRCGHLQIKLTLTDRTYHCKRCGVIANRDLNAAIKLNKVGRAHPEPVGACGHDDPVSAPEATEATSMDEAGSESRD